MTVGIILSGCGVFDGSEIQEAVAAMHALARAGVKYKCMAPNVSQMHVVDHYSGLPVEGEIRNVLQESARIARGDIVDLAKVSADDYDGFFFPGGFGAAKNLCSFATDGSNCTVLPEVMKLVDAARTAGKPMAFVCISPVIIAKILGGSGVTVTIGDDREASQAIEAMGATHIDCAVLETVIDEQNRVISSPAYMKAENITDLFNDIDASVKSLIDMIERTQSGSSQD